jgi:hypothetical protein
VCDQTRRRSPIVPSTAPAQVLDPAAITVGKLLDQWLQDAVALTVRPRISNPT